MICEDTPKIDIRGSAPSGHDIPAFGSYLSVYARKCNFGGVRYWFRCPGCDRNCCVLYQVNGLVRCRTCGNLRYRTELLSPHARRLRKALKIRRELGQTSGGLNVPFPEKPKGMHWKRYARLKLECAPVEKEYLMELGVFLERLQNRVAAW